MRRAPDLIVIDTLSEFHVHGQSVHGLLPRLPATPRCAHDPC
jgi:hypothetical protein